MTAEWTILRLLDWTSAYFAEHGVPNPRLDAELLLSEVLALKRIDLYLNFEKPVAPGDLARFKNFVQRRSKREPLQYIVGHTDFFGRRFAVTPDVLIPRPETEQLVARALEWLDAHPSATHVMDFGTGSGCIAITMALERPQLQVTAVDISDAALKVAKENIELMCVGVNRRRGEPVGGSVNARPSKPYTDAEQRLGGETATESSRRADDGILLRRSYTDTSDKFDLIISNPPYIPASGAESMQPEVVEHEPHLALFGGNDGLEFYRQLLQDAPRMLTPGSALALEIGAGQGDAILKIATAVGKWQTPKRYNDLSGVERILIFELKD